VDASAPASDLHAAPQPPPDAAGTAAPGGGSPRLEIPTTWNRDPYRYRVIRYPSGLVEVVAWQPGRERASGPSVAVSRDPSAPRRPDSIRRSKSLLRRSLLALDACYLLTLTTRANVEDYGESHKMVKAFLRKLRAAYPGVLYSGVPERQERGAWHWHLGINLRLPAAPVRDLWRSVCGDGNIDLQYRPPKVIASYLSKYLGKALSTEGGRVGYLRSRRIPEPEITEGSCDELSQALGALAGSDWSGTYVPIEAGGRTSYWAASWA